MNQLTAKKALDEAVSRFAKGEAVSEHVTVYSSCSVVSTNSLQAGELLELARLELRCPALSWRVVLDVDDTMNLRVLLRDVSAEDSSCLRVRGDIHVRPRSSRSEFQQCLPREVFPRPALRQDPIVTVMEGPGTVASVDVDTISELKVTMTTFYFRPRVDEEEEQSVIQLCVDFDNLLFSKDLADVVLVVDGEEIPAHRAILSARSQVFRTLFHKDPVPVRINLPEDVSLLMMNSLLHFMYTGHAEDDGENMKLLWEAACRFGVCGLEKLCVHKLLSGLRQDTALELWAYAEDQGFQELKQKALVVLVEHLREVTQSKDWRIFTRKYPSLAVEISETAAMILDFAEPK